MSLVLVGLLAASAQAITAPAPQSAANPTASNEASQAVDEQEAPQPPAQKAAAAAYRDYMQSLLRSLRASADPRDRAMATQLWFMEDAPDVPAEHAASGAALRKAAEAAPDDALVHWFWANAQAEDSGCGANDPCPHRADGPARIQPDNGAAWLPVLNAAWEANNVPAAEAALARMAGASRFDEPLGDAIKAWMGVYRRYPVPKAAIVPDSPDARFDDASRNFAGAMAFATATALPPYDALMRGCSRDMHPDASPQRLGDCARIGRLMMSHATTLIGSRIGRGVLRVSGQASAADRAEARVMDWRYEHYIALLKNEEDGFEPASITDWLETGDELQVMQRRFERAGVPLSPPAGWQPHGRDGQPIDPLGTSSAPTKRP